ncbi:MAG: prepilin peptidase [Kordiimonadaceae bacterium]|nr:prepilin peptidase [Kordiimonadaceae bacterium]
MQLFSYIGTGVLAAVAALLILAAISDIMHRRISNRLVVSIVALFAIWAVSLLANGAPLYNVLIWPLVTALIVFAVGAALFAVRLMGGGDVKLLAAIALFAGPTLSLPFVLYVVVAGGFVAAGTLIIARVGKPTEPTAATTVPYGVAITVGGLWVCFQQFSGLSA